MSFSDLTVDSQMHRILGNATTDKYKYKFYLKSVQYVTLDMHSYLPSDVASLPLPVGSVDILHPVPSTVLLLTILLKNVCASKNSGFNNCIVTSVTDDSIVFHIPCVCGTNTQVMY